MSPVPQTAPETLETAQIAFQYFTEGLKTGAWEAFLEMLTDDFSFWFPAGPFQGENVGKIRAKEFFHYVTEKIFSEGLSLKLLQITSNQLTVMFEVISEGKMLGNPYQNQAAISFEVRGNKICRYREYLGVIFVLQKP